MQGQTLSQRFKILLSLSQGYFSHKVFLRSLAPPLPAIYSSLFQEYPFLNFLFPKVPFFKGSLFQRFPFSKVPFFKGSLFPKVFRFFCFLFQYPFPKGAIWMQRTNLGQKVQAVAWLICKFRHAWTWPQIIDQIVEKINSEILIVYSKISCKNQSRNQLF